MKARRRRATRARKSNPRPRRRRYSRRRRNPHLVVRRRSIRASNPRRRRRSRRRRNPSAMRVGQIFKDMVYGAGGAIATRVGSSLVSGFVPSAIAGAPWGEPLVQATIAVTGTRWLGKRVFGQQQGDVMMLGGLISAGLAAADRFLPNIQGQLTGIIRAPVITAPAQGQLVAAGETEQTNGYSDVYDVPAFAGLGDVEDVDTGVFSNY